MAEITRTRSRARLLAAILMGPLLLAACGGDNDADDASDDSTPTETIDEIVDDEPTGSAEDDGAPEAKTLELDLDPITVGAFAITFTELEIVPSEFAEDRYTVTLAFTAANEMDDVRTPLSLGLDSIVLEAESGFLTGAVVDAGDVPGGRTGAGTISFESVDEIDPEEIPAATLIFGTADQNQPSVTLDGSAAESFNTIPVDVTVDDVSGVTRFQIDGGSIVFRDGSGSLLSKDRAILTIPLVTSATDQTGAGGEYIGPDLVVLDLPDGTSVAPEFLSRAVYPSDEIEEPLEFQIQAPVEGDYTISIGDEITVTFTVI